MTSAMVALANLTLGSAQASVTFASIPATYRDLRLVVTGGITSNGNGLSYLRFNSDTGGNYNNVQMVGTGSSAISGAESNQSSLYTGLYTPSGGQAVVKIDIMDYAQTDKHKTTLSRGDAPDTRTVALAGRWASTSAITSIQVIAESSTWLAGTSFALYGIVSA